MQRNEKCAEIEIMSITDMHKKIKTTNRTKDMLISRMHKIQEWCTDIKEKILQRGNQYIGELLPDIRGSPAIHRNIEGPEILKSEMKSVKVQIKQKQRNSTRRNCKRC